jgi:hypothetical protein
MTPDGWLVNVWWGNKIGKKFYYTDNQLHINETEWAETFIISRRKISTDFSQFPSSFQHKLLQAILSRDE